MTPPDSLAADAILRTLLYADVFGFPLTETEIHHFLIGVSATPEEVQATLRNSPCLAESVECINGYYVLRGRAELVRQREARNDASLRLWSVARRYGTWMAHLPFVRMVALTGALAMRNANDRDDDIDYLLVTKPGRVWTGRTLTVSCHAYCQPVVLRSTAQRRLSLLHGARPRGAWSGASDPAPRRNRLERVVRRCL